MKEDVLKIIITIVENGLTLTQNLSAAETGIALTAVLAQINGICAGALLVEKRTETENKITE